MVAIAVIASMVGIAARLLRGDHVPAAAGVLVAVWVAPLAGEPARLVVVAFVGAVLLAVLVANGAGRPSYATAAAFVGGSLFWSVPLTVHLATGTPGLRAVGATDDAAWAWTRAHSGFRNVVTHVASWAWGSTEQLGAVGHLARLPWAPLRWALPAMLVLVVMFAWHRRVVRWLAATVAAALVCSWQGYRLPWWLFHQSMATFGAVLVASSALLIGVGVDDGLHRWEQPRSEFDGTQSMPAFVGLALAMLVFVHPLLIGTVIPGARASRPSARVALPGSLREAGRTLDVLSGAGGALVLPLPDRVNRGTTWGYYGIDDLIGRLTARPALTLLPGAYYEASGAAPDLMRTAETSLARGDKAAFVGSMRALGAGYLVVRTDVTPAYGIGHDFTDWRSIVAAAWQMGLRSVTSFDQLMLFAVPEAGAYAVGTHTVQVNAAVGTDPLRATALAAPLLGTGVSIADRATALSSGTGVAWAPHADEAGFATTVQPGRYRVGVVPLGPALWRASVSGRSVTLEPADRAEVDGRSLLVRTGRSITGRRPPFALLVRDPSDAQGRGDVVSLGGDTVVQAGAGATVTLLAAEAPAFHFDQAKVGDCSVPGLPSDPTPGMQAVATINGVDISTRKGAACVSMPVPPSDELGGQRRWRFTVSYDGTAPSALRVCLWLESVSRCAEATSMSADARRGSIDSVIDTSGESLTGARLLLAVDHVGIDGDPATTVQLRDATLAPITADADPVAFPPAASPPVTVRVTAADTGLSLSAGNSLANLLGRFDLPGDDCNRYDDIPANVSATNLEGEAAPAFSLSADRHTACVSAPVSVGPGIGDLTANFAYRSERSGVARVALVDTTTGRPVATQRLDATSFWAEHQFRFTLPVGGVHAYRLTFYADGPGQGQGRRQTHADFRSVRLSPSTSFAIAAVPDPTNTPTTTTSDTVSATVRDLSHGYLAVHADADAVLVQHQAYAAGWVLDGLPGGVTSERFVADGWANGWVIHGLNGRSVVLRIRYRDDPVGPLAIWSLPLALLVALCCTDWSRLRSNRVRA
jgi:hypothetical protein